MIQKEYDCIGIGLCSWDEFMLVSQYPDEDSKIDVQDSFETPGGPVLNALRFLSALGKVTLFVGQAGDDSRGKRMHDQLVRENISLHDDFLNSKIDTSFSHIWVNFRNATRTISSTGMDIPIFLDERIRDIIVKSKTMLIDNRFPESKFEFLKFARENGVHTFCDFGTFRIGSFKLLEYIDTAILSSKFIEQGFSGMNPLKAIEDINKLGPEEIILTFGEKGIILKEKDKSPVQMPSFNNVDVVDTTGAGDIFHGAWIYGFLEDFPLHNIVRFASAAAALQCRYFGTKYENFNLKNVNFILNNGMKP